MRRPGNKFTVTAVFVLSALMATVCFGQADPVGGPYVADENTMMGGTNGLSKSGCIRGHMFAVQLRHKVNEHFKHRVQGEVFLPGDYYSDMRNDVATYVRYEIVLSW